MTYFDVEILVLQNALFEGKQKEHDDLIRFIFKKKYPTSISSAFKDIKNWYLWDMFLEEHNIKKINDEICFIFLKEHFETSDIVGCLEDIFLQIEPILDLIREHPKFYKEVAKARQYLMD